MRSRTRGKNITHEWWQLPTWGTPGQKNNKRLVRHVSFAPNGRSRFDFGRCTTRYDIETPGYSLAITITSVHCTFQCLSRVVENILYIHILFWIIRRGLLVYWLHSLQQNFETTGPWEAVTKNAMEKTRIAMRSNGPPKQVSYWVREAYRRLYCQNRQHGETR